MPAPPRGKGRRSTRSHSPERTIGAQEADLATAAASDDPTVPDSTSPADANPTLPAEGVTTPSLSPSRQFDAFMKDINHISIEMSNVVRKWAPNVKVAAGVEPPVPSSARGLQGAVSELEGVDNDVAKQDEKTEKPSQARGSPLADRVWGQLLSKDPKHPDVELSGSLFTVGSDGSCSMRILDPRISPVAARLSPHEGMVLLETMASKAVYAGNRGLKKAARVKLKSGSSVYFKGQSVYAYVLHIHRKTLPLHAVSTVSQPSANAKAEAERGSASYHAAHSMSSSHRPKNLQNHQAPVRKTISAPVSRASSPPRDTSGVEGASPYLTRAARRALAGSGDQQESERTGVRDRVHNEQEPPPQVSENSTAVDLTMKEPNHASESGGFSLPNFGNLSRSHVSNPLPLPTTATTLPTPTLGEKALRPTIRSYFEKQVVLAKDVQDGKESLKNLVSEDMQDILYHMIQVQLLHPQYSKFVTHAPSDGRRILLSGQPGSLDLQKKLILSVAKRLSVNVLVLKEDSFLKYPDLDPTTRQALSQKKIFSQITFPQPYQQQQQPQQQQQQQQQRSVASESGMSISSESDSSSPAWTEMDKKKTRRRVEPITSATRRTRNKRRRTEGVATSPLHTVPHSAETTFESMVDVEMTEVGGVDSVATMDALAELDAATSPTLSREEHDVTMGDSDANPQLLLAAAAAVEERGGDDGDGVGISEDGVSSPSFVDQEGQPMPHGSKIIDLWGYRVSSNANSAGREHSKKDAIMQGMRVRFLGPATTTKLRDLGGILRQLTGNGASHESKLPFSERICYPPIGASGTVVLEFDNSKVGVAFDQIFTGGVTLGGRCPAGTGAFVERSKLAIIEDDVIRPALTDDMIA